MGTKKHLVALASAFALTSLIAAMAPASAMPPPPIVGTGTVHCDTKSTLKFEPPLMGVGNSMTETVTLKSKLFNCTGTGDGANVVMGKSTAPSTITTLDLTANDCTAYFYPPVPRTPVPGDIVWKTLAHTPKLVNSTILFTSAVNALGPPITVDSSGSSTAGSFSGDAATSHAILKEDVAAITKKCTSANGLKALHIITPGSTFDLS